MSEIAFAKSFVSALDARPIKLRADYVHDQGHTPRAPYTLPRLSAPRPSMPKKTASKDTNPGSSKSITITLKSARNPVLEITLPNAPLSTTSVSDLKDAVRDRIVETSSDNKVALDKIKVLYKRKPVTGSQKTVAEVVGDAGEEELLAGGKGVEFGVMVMGGARVVDNGEGHQAEAPAAAPPQTEEGSPSGETTAKAAVGPSGEALLDTGAFWDDLQGYLEQRLKDEEVAKKLSVMFKDAWAASK
ncbi:cell-cycle control medial ring component [Aspergillus unguis]